MTTTTQTERPNRKTDPSKPSEPLDIYLREVESHDLLAPEEERRLLIAMMDARDHWLATFLHSEGALEAVWADFQAWERKEMSASSLIPGPPRLKPGQIGPEHHLPRLHRIFSKHVERGGERPFRYAVRRKTKRLVRILLHIGLRPKPLNRYMEAGIERHGASFERRVEKARQGFVESRRPLIERNLRLVLKVAWGYVPGPMSFDELIQEGNFGLIRATESFNRRFEVRFSTYAYLWIRQSVIRALEEKSRTIRLPVHLTHVLRKYRRESEQGAPIPEKVEYHGKHYRLSKLLASPTVTGGVVSLDDSRDDDGSMADSIPAKDEPHPESKAMAGDLGRFVRGSLKSLPQRLRQILSLRFGIGHSRPYTLREIGATLGVSSERIRQLQEEALRTLREGPNAHALEELVFD